MVDMWVYVHDCVYVIVNTWEFVHIWYVSFRAHGGYVRLLVFVRMILKKDVCDIPWFLHTWFLYIEEFSILPCPTCPTYQTYISVGLMHDTFVSALPCHVSEISACIRYDGWTAKRGIWETNIRNVRFCMRSGIHHVYAIWNVHAVVCSLWDSYPCSLWLSWDMCGIRVLSTTVPWAWFLYIEEFSILPCPTCPTYQTYISVGLMHDTFTDTLAHLVSKIERCIRYDGWCAKLRYTRNEHE